MKKAFQIFLLGVLISCTSHQTKHENCTIRKEAESHCIWQTDYDTILNREVLVKGSLIKTSLNSRQKLLDALNQRTVKCKLQFIRNTNDTIIIRVINDEVLTEQMGSSGARCYLAETIFTLTELQDVNYVQIKTVEGSHAMPGTYDRSDFKDLRLKK